MATFIFDLDGVVYRDRDPVSGAAEAIAGLRAAGHRMLYATNNATHGRPEFLQRMADVGVPAGLDDLATSASATAAYLTQLASPPSTVLVIGAPSLVAELEAVGIRVIVPPAEGDLTERPDCVVASLDRSLTYGKLACAQWAVLAGATLVATNRDPQFPGANGRLWPGAGSIVAAVEMACRTKATAIGKPGPLLYQTLLRAHDIDPGQVIVVGDNLETDIPGAVALDMASVLVLTGVSTQADLDLSTVKPTVVVKSLTELLDLDLEALLAKRGS
jgi:phosphoglycolate/pyridoxal phosphate phosphatase family enzyme